MTSTFWLQPTKSKYFLLKPVKKKDKQISIGFPRSSAWRTKTFWSIQINYQFNMVFSVPLFLPLHISLTNYFLIVCKILSWDCKSVSCAFLNSPLLEKQTTKPHQSHTVTFPDHTQLSTATTVTFNVLKIKTTRKSTDTQIRFLVLARVVWSVGEVVILFLFIIQYHKDTHLSISNIYVGWLHR